MQAIEQEIRRFVVDTFLYGEDDGRLGNDDSFLETGTIDSTGVLELVAFLEQRYGIAIGDEELVPENLDSIGRIVRFVGRKLAAAGSGA